MTLPRSAWAISGAGTLAALHVGAVNALWQHTRPDALIGTSAGSIVSGCLATGMTPTHMRQVVMSADYRKLIPMSPWLAPIRGYLASTSNARAWLLELTLGQSMADCEIPFTAISSDLNTGHVQTFGTASHPQMLVADAILASMSIPDVFPAFRGRYVDGGVLCNLGVQYLPKTGKRLALRVTEAHTAGPVTGFIDEQERLISMMLSASEFDEVTLARAYAVPVIDLPGGNLGFLNRGMTQPQKEGLYQAGYEAAQAWIDSVEGKQWAAQ